MRALLGLFWAQGTHCALSKPAGFFRGARVAGVGSRISLGVHGSTQHAESQSRALGASMVTNMLGSHILNMAIVQDTSHRIQHHIHGGYLEGYMSMCVYLCMYTYVYICIFIDA